MWKEETALKFLAPKQRKLKPKTHKWFWGAQKSSATCLVALQQQTKHYTEFTVGNAGKQN